MHLSLLVPFHYTGKLAALVAALNKDLYASYAFLYRKKYIGGLSLTNEMQSETWLLAGVMWGS